MVSTRNRTQIKSIISNLVHFCWCIAEIATVLASSFIVALIREFVDGVHNGGDSDTYLHNFIVILFIFAFF